MIFRHVQTIKNCHRLLLICDPLQLIYDRKCNYNRAESQPRICNGTDVNTVNGDWGPTPLQYASINGHSQVTRFLLGEEDIQVNNEGGVGQTALIIAIQTSHLEVCEILLESLGGNSIENLLA